MRAMILVAPGRPLVAAEQPVPKPLQHQLLLKIKACAVCRTDLHVVDGELPHSKLPLIPGHEIVAEVRQLGERAHRYTIGDRVGVPWLGWVCGECHYCRTGAENLCDRAGFTGYTLDGGYAEFTLADERFCLPLPDRYSDLEAAPLLCAGLIGYRSLRKAGAARRIGIYGFGAAAHLVSQIASFRGSEVYAFTRPGDSKAQAFARSTGAIWAAGSDQAAPIELDAAIIFAPVGRLVPVALQAVRKGGVVVCGGIHMSDIPSFPYPLLWGEKSVCSVANLTRKDGEEFMRLAEQIPLRISVRAFPLDQANQALDLLRLGKLEGAAVLTRAH